MKYLFLIIALLVLGIAPAKAQKSVWLNGNDFFTQCTSDNLSVQMMCSAYIAGVMDATNSICMPLTTTLKQTRDIVVKYLKENPQVRHHEAVRLVQNSLAPVFPCTK